MMISDRCEYCVRMIICDKLNNIQNNNQIRNDRYRRLKINSKRQFIRLIMYRPQSQLTRQRSNDLRQMQSKSKKPTNKQYKDYVKKLIQNNPYHIDSQKRLKIQTTSSNRSELKEKIQKKLAEDQKEMWRSGVARFIKPKLTDRDYKRFKKLFDIFAKIQKIKHQILSLSFSNAKYIKDINSLYQNQKLKQLKDTLLKLQLDQEKILLQVENQGKQNKNHSFSLQKVVNAYKRNSALEKKISDIQSYDLSKNSTKLDETQKPTIKESDLNQTPNSQNKVDSQMNKGENTKEKQPQCYLMKLYEFIWSLDSKKVSKGFNKSYEGEKNVIYEEIKNFILTKQKTIDQLFVSLTSVNSINHKEEVQMKCSQNGPQAGMNQFTRFHEIDKKSKNLNGSNASKKFTSFKSLFKQIEQDLIEYKQMNIIKERNNELAKKLLNTTKQLQKCDEERLTLEKQLKIKQSEINYLKQIKKQNQSLLSVNALLQKDNLKSNIQLQQYKQKLNQMENNLHQKENNLQQMERNLHQMERRLISNQKMQKQNQHLKKQNQNLQKENQNLQKYYRQTLTLEQQIKILSQQNQKLVQQIHSLKEKHSKSISLKQNQFKTNSLKQNQFKTNSLKQNQFKINSPKQSQIKINQLKQSQLKKSSSINEDKKQHKQIDTHQKSINNHQKSIKPTSNTSLIYKQFQKKNKKLIEENSQLIQQNTKLSQQINRLQEENKHLNEQITNLSEQNLRKYEQNKKLTEQNIRINQLNEGLQTQIKSLQEMEKDTSNQQGQLSRLRKDNNFLCQQNQILLEQNKKIQEQFEYLVKEKLQIESMLNEKNHKYQQIKNYVKKIKYCFREKMLQMQENLNQLKDDRQFIVREVSSFNNQLREAFCCFSEQIQNAIQVLLNNRSMGQQSHKQNVNKVSQMSVSKQQEKRVMMEQYERLALEFNHCLFELESFKGMFNQLEIEKELQKKYLQEDIRMLRLQICTLQSESKQIKSPRMYTRNNSNQLPDGDRMNGDSINRDQQTQQKQSNLTCQNVLSVYCQPQKIQIMTIEGNKSQVSEQERSDDKQREKLKINCELFSLTIPPQSNQNSKLPPLLYINSKTSTETQTQPKLSYQLTLSSNLLSLSSNLFSLSSNLLSLSPNLFPLSQTNNQKGEKNQQVEQKYQTLKQGEQKDEVIDEQDQGRLISFSQWIDSIQLQKIQQSQSFINFCQIHFQPITNTHKQQFSISQTKQQSKTYNHQYQINIKHSSNRNSPNQYIRDQYNTECINSNGSNRKNRNERMEDEYGQKLGVYDEKLSVYDEKIGMNGEKIGIFGSLYNKFSFPKLEQGKQQLPNQAICHLNNKELQLPLQINNIHKTQSSNQNNKQNQKQLNQPQLPLEQQDQSFDLCII